MLLETVLNPTSNSQSWRALVPCKVNLALDILYRRPDGYHALDTVMHAISICDELEVTPDRSGELTMRVELDDSAKQLNEQDRAWEIPSDQSNLVLRALIALRNGLSMPQLGGRVRLRKRIPSQAGLGGGSADAAAALVLGAIAWTGDYPKELVCRIASELGSDINFFLEGWNGQSWTARCTGRGELVQPLKTSYPLYFVVVHPPEGCNTKDIFRVYAEQSASNSSMERSVESVCECLARGSADELGPRLRNGLEVAAKRVSSWVERSAKRIDRYNHLGQCLSGSGSARFCLCSTHAEAEKRASELQEVGDMRVYAASTWFSPSIEEQVKHLRRGS